MAKFVVEDDFWSLFPNARIGVVVCQNINNSIRHKDEYIDLIRASEIEAVKHIPNEIFSSNQVIRVWREAFKKFKTKKGARSSIEALLKRIKNGNHLGTINPLVDIYNSISLKYGLPCGGEDIDKFVGDIRLTRAIGNEGFITLGSDESAPPFEGEVIYKDEEGAICRCWNWRESVRTMLTEDTRNAFMCIESIDVDRLGELHDALKDLAETVQGNLGGVCTIFVVDINNKNIQMMIE